MRPILITALLFLFAVTGSAQQKLTQGADGYFKFQIGNQPVLSYAQGQYEIVKDHNNYIGLRNINNGTFISSTYQPYSNWRINGNTPANVTALLDSLRKYIYTAGIVNIDSAGSTTVNNTANDIDVNIAPSADFTINIDTVNTLTINGQDTVTLTTTNDSTFSWKVTDSLTLNPLTYKSVSFSVTEGTATLRCGSRNTTDLPAGYSASFTASGLLVERIRIVATSSGIIFVTATK